MTVIVTKHAIERATKRFNVRINAAEEWIKSRFIGAEFIADVVSDEGKESRLFTKEGVTFLLAPDSDTIITVYKPFNYSVVDKVRKTVKRELEKAQRQARKIERENQIKIAELEVIVANRRLNQLKARSPKVRAIIETQINELNEKITSFKSEIVNAKREMSQVAKGVAAYL